MADTMVIEGDDTVKETGTQMRRQEDKVRLLVQPFTLELDPHWWSRQLAELAGHIYPEGPQSLASR